MKCNASLHIIYRHYDIKHYYKIIRKVKHAITNISLSTDIIVGFPGETDKDYNQTLKLLKKVRYDQVFAFMYSPRSGTPAVTFTDQIEETVKNKRVNNLLSKQKIIQKDLQGNFVKSWNSMREIQRQLGISVSNISDCCNKKIKQSHGYIWEYESRE